MSIKERRLQELALIYFYLVKQGKRTVGIATIKHEIDVNENELISDLEFLGDEGYIEIKKLQGNKKRIADLRVLNVIPKGKKVIEDPFFIYDTYNNNTNNNIMNINIGSIQGNNNVSHILQSNTLNISDAKISEIEKQIDEIRESLNLKDEKYKKYFDDLKEKFRQRDKAGVKEIVGKIIQIINNVKWFTMFVIESHNLIHLLFH